ncbi:MAG: EamA family transporter [bacterium]|nr:EamA family transporter [bacterium]
MVVLAYLALCLIWGTTYLVIKVALEGFPPFLLGAVRFAAAGVIFLPFMLRRKSTLPKTRGQWGYLILTGVLMLAGGNGLVNFAEQYLDSGLTALTVATSPTWSAILGALFFSSTERLDRWSVVGILLATAGVWVLHHDHLTFASAAWPGVAAALVCPIVWTFGSLIARKHGYGLSPVTIAAIQMLSGAAAFVVISLLVGESWRIAPSSRAFGALVYLTVLGSVIAFTAYAYVLSKIPAAKANTYTLVNPIIALVAGALILDEPVTPEVLPATALIIAGLVLLYLMRNRTPRAA